MKTAFLQKFLLQIEPFFSLWRSIKFVIYAGKTGDTWVFLGGRSQFSEESVKSHTSIMHAEFETFLAFTQEFPIADAPQILGEIVEKESFGLSLGEHEYRNIRFCAEGDQGPSWFNPYKFDRTRENSLFKTKHTGFVLTVRVDRQIQTRPELTECLERASERLRMNSHIDGVGALARKLTPGFNLNPLMCPELQVVAALPFDLSDTHTGMVRLVIPQTAQPASVSVRAFFYPEPQPSEAHIFNTGTREDQHGPSQIDWEPDWPETATHANIHLFWDRHAIDACSINRWSASASLLGAVDEYFDPEHSRLRASLRYTDKKKSDSFELAVVRLLNVLEIPAIWYGKTAEDRADAVAIINSDVSKTLLLIECTREKPALKFSTVAERAKHLSQSLQIKAEVIPVVFTAARVVESDIRAAVEYGVGLIGSDQIEELLQLIATPNVSANETLRHLRPSKTITDFILGGTAGQLWE